jgi:xanthine dehydrogenase YagS FAD-binding subunit
MMPAFAHVRPSTLDEALSLLSAPGARAQAGGTDLLGCLRDQVFEASTLVSLGRLDELRGIREASGGLAIGALTAIADVASSPVVRERFAALAEAAREVGSPQLRNQGTLGGNLCQRPRCWYYRGGFHCARKGGDTCFAVEGENRYHAILGGGPCFIVHPSDTAAALVALRAAVRLAAPSGRRTVPLESLFVLPYKDIARENVLAPGEIVTEVLLPPPPPGLASSYRKVRERGSWDFALAGVAIAIERREGKVVESRVVLSGVAPVPWRAEAAEEAMRGRRLTAETASRAAKAAVRGAAPLAQNGYKVPLVRGIVEEALLAV